MLSTINSPQSEEYCLDTFLIITSKILPSCFVFNRLKPNLAQTVFCRFRKVISGLKLNKSSR